MLMELLNIIVEEEIDVDVLFKGEEIGLVNKNYADWECEHNVFIGKCWRTVFSCYRTRNELSAWRSVSETSSQ